MCYYDILYRCLLTCCLKENVNECWNKCLGKGGYKVGAQKKVCVSLKRLWRCIVRHGFTEEKAFILYTEGIVDRIHSGLMEIHS